MEGTKFTSSRENPRNLGFVSDRASSSSSSGKTIASDAAQKPSPPLLERFREALKQREEEIGAQDVDAVISPPRIDEIVEMYENVLSELTFNSKPMITDLTIIAGEQKGYEEGIADAICARILEVPVEQKLPSLYLLDSIVKNIGKEYVRHFGARLPKVFCTAYRQVPSALYPSMRHLFGTWAQVFPESVLCRIETELQFSSFTNHQTSSSLGSLKAESPSPRPSHGIHVNPKYLEARRQFEHSSMDSQNARTLSSSFPVLGQKSTSRHSESDFDQADVSSASDQKQIEAGRISTSTVSVRSPSRRKFFGSNPQRIKKDMALLPSQDAFVEVISKPHTGYGFILAKESDRDVDEGDWWDRKSSQQQEASGAYSFRNGHDQVQSRALIDAYGSHKEDDTSSEKLPKVPKIPRLDLNGFSTTDNTRKWQNSEEEEYVWEDMSPTLADRGRNIDQLLPDSSTSGLDTASRLRRMGPMTLEHDSRRSNWMNVHDTHTEDRIHNVGSGHVSMNKRYLDAAEARSKPVFPFQSRHHVKEAWNFPQYLPHSSHNYLGAKSKEMHDQIPFSGRTAIPLLSNPKLLFPINDEEHDPSFQSYSRINSKMQWSPKSSKKEMHTTTWLPSKSISYSVPPASFTLNPKKVPGQFELRDTTKGLANEGLNKPVVSDQHQINTVDRRNMSRVNSQQLSHSRASLISTNQTSQEQFSFIRPQLLQSRVSQESFIPLPSTSSVPHLVAQSSNYGQLQGQSAIKAALPPLPLGPPPLASQMGHTLQNTTPILPQPSQGDSLTNLIGSLVAKGLISLSNPVPTQNSLGVDFDTEILKVRHEFAIDSLYTDLPRQCTTCGLRFKFQEEHSTHMDWHVSKNRLLKSAKQKPSRKWFVSAKEWLSGAEALGNDSVPGFLPSEPAIEKGNDEETAVPADYNQNACALCGEPFIDFFSDETEEWMYKGAVYLNALDGSIDGMEKSQLGSIVHAKCRSESTIAP